MESSYLWMRLTDSILIMIIQMVNGKQTWILWTYEMWSATNAMSAT